MEAVCEDMSGVNIGGTKELLELGEGQVRAVNCFFFAAGETGELDRGEQREGEKEEKK
jgi:hypothetical protein